MELLRFDRPFRWSEIFEATGYIALNACLFLLPYPRSWVLYPFALLLVSGLLIWIPDFRGKLRSFLSGWLIILPPLVYFFVNLISSLVQNGGYRLIGHRMMFFLIPVLGFTVFNSKKMIEGREVLLKSFLAGLASVSVILLIRSVIYAFSGYDGTSSLKAYIMSHGSFIFSEGYSIFQHPTYFSLELNFAMVILWKRAGNWNWRRSIKIIVFVLLSCSVLFAASKTGILIWIIIIVWIIVDYGRRKSFGFKQYGLIFLFLFSFVFLAGRNIERVSFFVRLIRLEITGQYNEMKNFDQRTREWYTASQIIRNKPLFGAGIAKIETTMNEMFLKNGFSDEASRNFNAHNQFLETQMTFGIPGTLSLLWMLLTPLIFRKRLQYPDLAAVFVFMMTFFLMFESMFVRQWGIIFFTLFYCLLVLSPSNKNS
jgi:O-antigen ligase